MMKKSIKLIALTTILTIILPIIAYAMTYIGNARTYKFHIQGCRAERRMNEANRIYFSSRQEAINAGMVPCKICRP